MRLGKVLTAQQNVKVALLGRKGEKNVGARSLLMLILRVGHAACANAEFDSAACNNGSAAVTLRSSRRFIGWFLPGDFGFGCWKQPSRNR
jgi:hypothetical protein